MCDNVSFIWLFCSYILHNFSSLFNIFNISFNTLDHQSNENKQVTFSSLFYGMNNLESNFLQAYQEVQNYLKGF